MGGHEYNGDSGYEAESKPDEEEDETLMNSSYHGNGSYQGEVTPSSLDSHTYNVYSEGTTPPSPESKTSNYLSDNVSPLTHSDMSSSGKTSPTTSTPDSKIRTYDFATPVIDKDSELSLQKSSVLSNGGDHT